MACEVIEERLSGTELVGAIERIYRCDNDYGAVVLEEPPGSEFAGRITVTPVKFFGPRTEDYEICSVEKATEGLASGELLRSKTLRSPEELELLLDRLAALSETD